MCGVRRWEADGLGTGPGREEAEGVALTTTMKKALSLCLLSLVTFIVIMTSPRDTNAMDVCAPDVILPAQATAICQKVCAEARPISQFNGQWNNDSPTCHFFWTGQYGVCGCNPIPCQCTQTNKQTYCDESLSPGGPNTCSSDCNCTEGRTCVNNWCQGTPGRPCCSQCRPVYQTCMTFCNGVPFEQRGNCQSLCGADLNGCTSGCRQC